MVPERTAFVDDRPENVAVAEEPGMAGVVFTDPDTLRAQLVGLGLLDGPRPSRP